MGWQDRRYEPEREESGFRRALRKVFGEGANFYSWALPLFTVWGIRVRIHLIFVVMIVAELIQALLGSGPGWQATLIRISVLFVLVLLHELGHCFACRWVGGDASDILMWPLGGLAMCAPPHNARANLITTAGGPMVNVLLVPILGGVLLALGAPRGMLLFNLFHPSTTFNTAVWMATSEAQFYLHLAVWWAYVMNMYLLLFNMLLPMFPMDAGRLVQEALWFRMGFIRSMQIAVNVGLFMAVAVGIYGAVANASQLMMIAIFCGLTCWMERQRVAMLEPDGIPGYNFDRGYQGMPGDEPQRPSKRANKAWAKRVKEEQELTAEVDRILEKIRTEGMASLTRKEKGVLKGETERKRKESAGR